MVFVLSLPARSIFELDCSVAVSIPPLPSLLILLLSSFRLVHMHASLYVLVFDVTLHHLRAQAITKNGGERMTAWCDVAAPWPLTPASADDSAGLALSVAGIHAIVRQLEADGVPAERIVLAGFSQVSRNFPARLRS
jgi:hypothetical protein